MTDGVATVTPDERVAEPSEERLAELLRELELRRAPLREELRHLDDAAARLEHELAGRGSGG